MKNDMSIVGRNRGQGHVQSTNITTITIVQGQGQGISQKIKNQSLMSAVVFLPHIDFFNKSSEERRKLVARWEEEAAQKKYEDEKQQEEAQLNLGIVIPEEDSGKITEKAGHKQ